MGGWMPRKGDYKRVFNEGFEVIGRKEGVGEIEAIWRGRGLG